MDAAFHGRGSCLPGAKPKRGRLPGPKFDRPHLSSYVRSPLDVNEIHTDRPLTQEEIDSIPELEASARFPVVVCIVKTGSDAMLKAFWRWIGVYGLEAKPADGRTDEGRCAYGIEANKDLNANVTDHYLVWGLPEPLTEFLERNEGPGKCLNSYYQPVNVRVSMGTGQSQLTDGTRKKVREAMRPKLEREYREEIRNLDKIHPSNPASPRHGERERIAHHNASMALQSLFDTDANLPEGKRITDTGLRKLQFALEVYYLQHGRNPTDRDALFEFFPELRESIYV